MDVKVFMEALEGLEEKGITKDVVFDALEEALLNACKQHFGTKDNFTVFIDRDKIECRIIQSREVVEEVENEVDQISLEDAVKIDKVFKVGDTVNTEIDTKEFSRVATQNAKGTITQRLRDVEKSNIYSEYSELNNTVVTGPFEVSQNHLPPLMLYPRSGWILAVCLFGVWSNHLSPTL